MKKIIVILAIIVFVVALAFAYFCYELRQLDWGLAAEFKATEQNEKAITYETDEVFTLRTEVQY